MSNLFEDNNEVDSPNSSMQILNTDSNIKHKSNKLPSPFNSNKKSRITIVESKDEEDNSNPEDIYVCQTEPNILSDQIHMDQIDLFNSKDIEKKTSEDLQILQTFNPTQGTISENDDTINHFDMTFNRRSSISNAHNYQIQLCELENEKEELEEKNRELEINMKIKKDKLKEKEEQLTIKV